MTIKMLKLDETKIWGGEIRGKVARIFGVYVFDDSRRVQSTQLTSSYECHFVGSMVRWEEDILESDRALAFRDVLESDMQAPDVQYIHINVIDVLPTIEEREWPEWMGAVSVLKDIRGDSSGERIEAAIEYVRESLP